MTYSRVPDVDTLWAHLCPHACDWGVIGDMPGHKKSLIFRGFCGLQPPPKASHTSTVIIINLYNGPAVSLLSQEDLAAQVVSTLCSGIGLVLVGPVTTRIAALLVPQELTQIEENRLLNAMRIWWYSFIPRPAAQASAGVIVSLPQRTSPRISLREPLTPPVTRTGRRSGPDVQKRHGSPFNLRRDADKSFCGRIL